MELEALAKAAGEIEAAGATLVAIAPQSTALNAEIKKDKKLGIEILSDPGNEVADKYGIRHTLPDYLTPLYTQFGINLPEFNGDDSWTLPMPARYIIDQGSNVCYARVNADYTQRPEPDETVAALKELK